MTTGSAKKDLQRRQRRWAEGAGVGSDGRGYVRRLEDNLRAPLSGDARASFTDGPELAQRLRQPPKFHALHSSAALVANVFDYWSGQDASPLVAALGFAGRCERLRFEARFPTGLAGEPPTVDLLLLLDGGRQIAVESKFSEWLTRRPRNKAVFKDKYFPPGRALWAESGLPRCQALAEALQTGAERFRYLHAAQLLKHALGLSVSGTGQFSLCYAYYDWPSRESAQHGSELEQFAAAVAPELSFSAVTYQDVYRRLRDTPAAEPHYVDYLRRRYFGDVR